MNGVNKFLNVSIKVIFFVIYVVGVCIKFVVNNYVNKKFVIVKVFFLMSLWVFMLEFFVYFCGLKCWLF